MDRLIDAYMKLRNSIGVAGIALALLMVLGGLFSGMPIQNSISAYYWTTAGDVLVGILFVAGALLVTYVGYDKTDNWITTIAGVMGFGVALFPTHTGYGGEAAAIGYFQLPVMISQVLHYTAAAGFFLLLSYMSYFQFTKTARVIGTPKKEQRNAVFRTCGLTMVGTLVLIGLFQLFLPNMAESLRIVFWLEAVALTAFGVSWLVKGQMVLADIE